MHQTIIRGAALLWLASPPVAHSATAPLENLTITANRTPTPAVQVGSAVSSVNRATIENRQTVFVSDVLQDLPGIAVSRAGNFGSQTQVRVRGAEGNHVLVLIDGVEANDPAGSDDFSFEHLNTYDVERVEVVRGPQSALWGSDAVAGVINVITRQTDQDLRGEGFMEGGSFSTVYGGGRLGGSWSAGAIDVGVSRYDTDGENIAREGSETDGYENTTASLKAAFRLSSNLNLNLFARYTDATSEFDEIGPSGLPEDSDAASDVAQTYLRASGDLSLLDGRWEQSLRLTWYDSERDEIRDGNKTAATAAERYGIYYQTSYRWGDQADGPAQTLTFAIDHENEDFSQRGDVLDFGFGIFDPNQDQDMDTTGYVLEYQARPLAPLSLAGSVRYDDNSDYDDITTWRVTGVYRFDTTGTRLRGSYGTGQKRPTFVERFGFFPNQFIGNPDLRPEESTGWDVGADQSFLEGRLRLDVTYFNEKLEDEINGFVQIPDGFTADNMDGTSRRKGVEVEFHGHLTDGLDAGASYTYTDSRQPDTAGGGRVREIRRPRHMAALNLNYAFLEQRANLNLNASYTGEQTDTFFPPFPEPQQTVRLDGYTLVNLAASYTVTDRVTVYGRVENLFDKDYENVFGFATPGIGGYVGFRVRVAR